MTKNLYRYEFDETASTEDIESALLLAIWGCEALHGEAETRLDASHYLDPTKRALVVDASTPVGRDLNRLFTGFIGHELGPDAFAIEHVTDQVQLHHQETAA